MSELTYKKIVDVEQVETLNGAATVFINDNGAMKQVAADKFGAVKTVNGVEPDENGNIEVEVSEIPEPVQPDWNQNDPTSADYVKGRTHWAETATTTLVNNATVETTDGEPTNNPFVIDEIIEGQTYVVTWNGTTHECVAYIAEGPNSPSLGNATLADIPSGGNGEPFFITVYEGAVMVFAAAGTHTVSIVADIETIHTIDPKFIPGPQEIDLRKYTHWVATGMDRKKLNDVILDLFANGGGTILCRGVDDAFWKDINTNRPIQFIFDLSAFGDLEEGSTLLKCNAQGKTFASEDCYQISCQYVGTMSGVTTRVTTLFERANLNETGTHITVIIENLNIP